ncbi:mitochondrial carrier [Macrolepiota fuliginosa MF-IS2]|uniref:Mitochondrial carrier n=1 Tax=Macrolepiota fuliginosa MF-IS2 TaxID=1400762 RepID=A0A9P6C3S4_9AGAR|nr:mitochondrial carrier [Macrolepiota fuliginosa MF-IS2]
MLLGFFDIIVLFLSIGISLLIVVPLTGVLVRFRANYNPKALQLDAEGGAAPHTGPVINSYFSMMTRVWRLEGISGLYKGLMPTAISTFSVTILLLIFMETPKPRHGRYRAPEASLLGTFAYSIGMMLVALPTAVITYRSITTPHKLGYLELSKSLRVLLTPTERKKPWILYLTPGLLAAEVLHIIIVILILSPLHRLLLPAVVNPELDPTDISVWKAAVYFVILAFATIIVAPLEVIATRLAIQRNHASSEYNSVAQEVEGDGEETVEYSGTDEDVIGLRHEGDPYTGLVDCAKRIVDEEGIMTLYRAWWVTLLGGLASAFT